MPTLDEIARTNLKESEKKKAFNKNKPGAFSGDFYISKMILRSVNVDIENVSGPANFIDLKTSAWNELNVYEDINSPVISGDITIADSVGFIESFPIMGEEILELSFSTAGAPQTPTQGSPASNQAPKIIDNRFRVYKVDPPIKVTDNTRTVKLHFVSDSQFTNMLSRVLRTYPVQENIRGTKTASNDLQTTISDMVRNIFYDFFIGSKKPSRQLSAIKEFKVEPTRHPYQMSLPNWTPFKCISFLASKAISASPHAGGANFVFYQTLQGFRFVSVETLMQGGFSRYLELNKTDAIKKNPSLQNNIDRNDALIAGSSYIPIYDPGTVSPAVPNPPPHVATYKYAPANVGENNEELSEIVTEYRLVHSVDTMKNLGSGMYGSKVLTHDPMRMKVDRVDYQYIKPKDNIQIIDANKNISTIPNTDIKDPEKLDVDNSTKAENGKTVSENADFLGSPQAKVMLAASNKGHNSVFQDGPKTEILRLRDKNGLTQYKKVQPQTLKDEKGNPIKQDIKEKHVEDTLARRESQKRQMDTIKIQFSAPGDSAREVGDLISFDYPTENPKSAQTGIADDCNGVMEGHKYYSGKFLITALRHRITQDEYTIHVEAVKDGYKSKISAGFEQVEPEIQNSQGNRDPEPEVSSLVAGETRGKLWFSEDQFDAFEAEFLS